MRLLRRTSVAIVLSTALTLVGTSGLTAAHLQTLRGSVESGGTGLEGYEVSLLATFAGAGGQSRILGRDTTDGLGEFEIDYGLPRGLPSKAQPVLFVLAGKGPVMLASAVGQGPLVGPVVVNELTTVATGFAFAQFVDGKVVKGAIGTA